LYTVTSQHVTALLATTLSLKLPILDLQGLLGIVMLVVMAVAVATAVAANNKDVHNRKDTILQAQIYTGHCHLFRTYQHLRDSTTDLQRVRNVVKPHTCGTIDNRIYKYLDSSPPVNQPYKILPPEVKLRGHL